MVAIRGTGWGLAPCLVELVNECDDIAPNRSTASDGSIGDPAHSARTSDHNPDDGWVCAVDITDDKTGGCDADLLARHIVAARDPRVKYVIWNGTIAKSYESNGHRAWEPQPYTGTNPHDKHTHISVHNTSDARLDLSPWWPQIEPEQITLQWEDTPMLYDDPDRSGIYLVHGGKLAQFTDKTDQAEVKKMAKDPSYVGKLTKAGAEQFRKVFLQ